MLLLERLQARRPEIEATISNRVFSVADPAEIGDPGYTAGLREAVSVAIDYALHAIFETAGKGAPVPPALFVQAREAARNGVSLDTVLRRYLAGHTLLGDFILQEAKESLSGESFQRVCRVQATLFDRVLEAITDEYKRHADTRTPSVEEARAERVCALLAGELIDPGELGYPIDGRRHLGAIAQGPDARSTLRDLSTRLDSRLLLVQEGRLTWAWLGTERELDASLVLEQVSNRAEGAVLALGEPGEDLPGWRLTHRQAKAALAIARQGSRNVVRYGEVGLLAAVLDDEVAATSLRKSYLRPLEEERDGGEALRETLRAYFATERNVTSTAALLGVNRSTVINRLQLVDQRLGQPVSECSPELEVALRLDELDRARPTNKLLAREPLLPTH